jgi:spore maturation protein CgeB
MKILIIQEKSRHPQNVEFRESLCLQRAFLRQHEDVTVIVWGLGYSNFNVSFDVIVKDCDIIFLIENYGDEWIPDLSKYKNKLKIFWSIDAHCALDSHIDLCIKNKIDLVLSSSYYYKKYFNNSHHFPNAYPKDLIYPLNVNKNKDVGFCGNVVNREMWFNSLNIHPDIMKIGQDMIKCINSYKIHWNRNMSNDINYRTFETLGCRTFLLTDKTDILLKIFEDKKHLVLYDGVDDCKEKIKYYLEHENERINIETVGYEHVINNHTYDNRVNLFMNIIKEKI